MKFFVPWNTEVVRRMRDYLERLRYRFGSVAIAGIAAISWPRRVSGPTLVVRSAAIGDFLVIVPYIAALIRDIGKESVDVLLLQRSSVDPTEVLESAVHQRFRLPLDSPRFRQELRELRRVIRKRKYAQIIFVPFNGETTLGKLKKILLLRSLFGFSPRLKGFNYHRNLRVPGVTNNALATHQAAVPFLLAPRPAPHRALVEQMLQPPETARRIAHEFVRGQYVAHGTNSLVALYITSKVPRKQWPIERYADLAQHILRNPSISLAIVGGPEDAPTADAFVRDFALPRTGNACGIGDLWTTFALLQCCISACGNDGSPIHLAALAGIPVLSIFCNFEPAGLWEPTLAIKSVSVRPAQVRQSSHDDYGIINIPSQCITDAFATLKKIPPGIHHLVTIDPSGRMQSHTSLMPTALQENSTNQSTIVLPIQTVAKADGYHD